jgi:hypothetical protein
MTRIIKDLEAHYETHEVPFGRTYEWHPEQIIVECDCSERLTLIATSTTTVCRCGTEHGAIIRDIQKREGRLPDKTTHPWHYDTKEQSEQHLRDEAAHPKDSPLRYNDITSGNTNDV